MRIAWIFASVFFVSCESGEEIETIVLDIDPSTIPEGIAVHPASKDIFISSVHLDKITKSNSQGKNSTDVIPPKHLGYTAGVGMGIKRNYLFALGSVNRKKQSMVLQIDLMGNEIVNSFKTNDSIPNYFNDLAIDNGLNAYITDTEFHKIYRLDYRTGTIALFLENEQIKYPNGIAISEDGSKLFIDSYTSGIRIVDIKTKTILNAVHLPSANKGIDGLKYHGKNLYAIINGGNDRARHGLVRYRLSEDESSIIQTDEILMNHTKMNLPTTLSIVDDEIYVLANSQLDNLDQEENTIIDLKLLDTIYILKVKVPEDIKQ